MSERQRQKHLVVTQAATKRDILDYLVYFFTFATPLFEVPQAIEIFANHSAKDVSVWTWAFFCIDNFVWIIYALRRHLKPVLITSILFEIIEVTIFIGVILYR